jgi:hypothetical protein
VRRGQAGTGAGRRREEPHRSGGWLRKTIIVSFITATIGAVVTAVSTQVGGPVVDLFHHHSEAVNGSGQSRGGGGVGVLQVQASGPTRVTINPVRNGKVSALHNHFTGTITGSPLVNETIAIYSERSAPKGRNVDVHHSCLVDDDHRGFTCSDIGLGPAKNGRGAYRVWVAVVDDAQRKQNEHDLLLNSPPRLTQQPPPDGDPPHVPGGIAYIDVWR